MVRTALALAVVVMANYLAAQFDHRFYLSSQTHVALSSRTLTVLNSLTNQVNGDALLRHARPDNFYPTLLALANEYHAANKNISVRTVDYITDPGAAEKVKEQYDLPGSPTSPNAPPGKNLIIFASGDRHDVVPGDAIVKYTLERTAPDDPKQKELQFRRKPVQFNGGSLGSCASSPHLGLSLSSGSASKARCSGAKTLLSMGDRLSAWPARPGQIQP